MRSLLLLSSLAPEIAGTPLHRDCVRGTGLTGWLYVAQLLLRLVLLLLCRIELCECALGTGLVHRSLDARPGHACWGCGHCGISLANGGAFVGFKAPCDPRPYIATTQPQLRLQVRAWGAVISGALNKDQWQSQR